MGLHNLESANQLLKNISRFASAASLSRGMNYYRNGHVKIIECQSLDRYMFWVQGSKKYSIQLQLQARDIRAEVKSFSCSCPYFRDSGEACKHVVAAYLSLINSKKLAVDRPIKSEDRYLDDDEIEKFRVAFAPFIKNVHGYWGKLFPEFIVKEVEKHHYHGF